MDWEFGKTLEQGIAWDQRKRVEIRVSRFWLNRQQWIKKEREFEIKKKKKMHKVKILKIEKEKKKIDRKWCDDVKFWVDGIGEG